MVGHHSRVRVSPAYDADTILDVEPAYDEEFNEQPQQYRSSSRRPANEFGKQSKSSSCRKIVILLGVAALVTAVVTTTVVLVDRNKKTSSQSDTSSSLFDAQDNVSSESVIGSGFAILGVDKDNEHDMVGHDIDPVDIEEGAGGFLGEIVTGQDVGNGNGNGNGNGIGNGKKNGHKKQDHVDDNIMDTTNDNDAIDNDDDEPVDCACVTKGGNKNDRGRQQIKNEFESNNGKRNGRNLSNDDDEIALSDGNVIVYKVTTTKRKMKDLKEHKWKDKQNKQAEFECDKTIEIQSIEPCDETIPEEDRPPECFEDEERRLEVDEDKPWHNPDKHQDKSDRRRLGVCAGKAWHYHLGQANGIGMKREIYKALVMSGIYDTRFRPINADDPGDIWRVVSEGSKEVTVCIVDSGYDYDHPDLPKEPQVSGDDYLNPSGGNQQPRSWKHDGIGHGTQVAGIIAAQPNGKVDSGSDLYVEGVAPNIKLHIVRAFDDNGSANTNDLIHTLNQCRAKGVDVINLSLRYGTTNFAPITDLLTDMYENDGIITFGAAGNNDYYYSRGALTHPAAIPSVVSVTGINNGYSFLSYSNWNEQVEFAARGNAIPTTRATGGYTKAFGTSFSTSFGAGVAALLLSHHKGVCSPQEVRSCMAKMAKVCNTGLSSGLPKCEVCDGVDLSTGLKTCPNQDPSTSPCPENVTLSTCGNQFNPPAICDQTAGTCCDNYLDGYNTGFGHGVMQAKATNDALLQDCGCGSPRIQTLTTNICDVPCTADAHCDDGNGCSTSDSCDANNVCSYSPDGDGDRYADCIDDCPFDSNKIHPGQCGCGVSEIDSDADDTPDCIDGCPFDRNKIAPGDCGCGKPECSSGYHCPVPGDCANINECDLGTHNCHADATCTDTEGSFYCSCNSGFGGDGVTCTTAPTDLPSTSPSTLPSSSPSHQPTGLPTASPSSSPSSFPSTAQTQEPSGQPSGTPTSLPSSRPTNVPTSSTFRFIENRSPTQSSSYSYQGPKQYEQGITLYEDSCVNLKVMNDNTIDQRCKHLSYDFDLICPSEANKFDGDNTKFRLFSTLTCAASSGPFSNYDSDDDWHMHAKWEKNNGDIKVWDDRRKCTDDRNGKSLKDLGCRNNAIDIPVATVEVWFYAAKVDTEPNDWEDATNSTTGYCYFEYEMKCNCRDCD